MITRALAFLLDLIVFLMTYCFIFVSILILFFDRLVDYNRFLDTFYILIGISAYLYFILPLFLFGKTLGKKIFRIQLIPQSGIMYIAKVHIKYIVGRLFPIIAALLLLDSSSLIIQILLGLFILFPVADYIYLKTTEIALSDKLLHLEIKMY